MANTLAGQLNNPRIPYHPTTSLKGSIFCAFCPQSTKPPITLILTHLSQMGQWCGVCCDSCLCSPLHWSMYTGFPTWHFLMGGAPAENCSARKLLFAIVAVSMGLKCNLWRVLPIAPTYYFYYRSCNIFWDISKKRFQISGFYGGSAPPMLPP